MSVLAEVRSWELVTAFVRPAVSEKHGLFGPCFNLKQTQSARETLSWTLILP